MIENQINYIFKNKKLLEQALTHKSFSNEYHDSPHNERLEFFGDSILGFVVAEFLYKKLVDESEGKLSVVRSALVDSNALFETAEMINLLPNLRLSKGQNNVDLKNKKGIAANACEALIGAIYIDGGFDEAKKFIDTFILSRFQKVMDEQLWIDPKTQLQEILQNKEIDVPKYEVIKETGPDHNKTFSVDVLINDERTANGVGTSRQEAEKDAAKKALKKIS